jgi:adenylosuccinate synthase
MPVTAVVGAQWGDEGKGRIIDNLAQDANLVFRFQGGDNAGHTVVNDFGKNILHLVPCGIFYPHVTNIIGTGCVVNPQSLLAELAALEAVGVNTDKLLISNRAHLLLPYHRLLDELEESDRGSDTIGTTKRGVGPAYADKAARSGLRMGDLLQPEWLEGRLDSALRTINRKLEILGGKPVDGRELFALCMEYRDKLAHRIVDTVPLVRRALANDEQILLEGQLALMRDLDWGIYPYVTSSNPSATYASVGAGLPAGSLSSVVGVVKAYSSCVGDGPFPVELHDEDGAKLRSIGQEFGATTGRPRRCGWFDAVAVNYVAWLNGMTQIAITKLDVLDTFATLKLCVGYRLPTGEIVTDTMPDTPLLYEAQPVYEEWEGWNSSTEECRRWADLPPQAQRYLARIQELVGVPIAYVSVGPKREQMFALGN